VIGDFLFSDKVLTTEIMVRLEYDSAGKRAARMMVPRDVAVQMADANYPSAPGSMTVESALAFALMLAVRSKRSLVITGDPSVWDASWGVLLETKFAAPATEGS